MSKVNVNKRKLLVLYVGGVFGMKSNRNGYYTPAANSLVKFMKRQGDMHDSEYGRKMIGTMQDNELVLPEIEKEPALLYEIRECNPLQDSANMRPDKWVQIATDISSNYETYDGFIILHGTDTMCYSASALSFMLVGLQKPVIFTGSQKPIYESSSLPKRNFIHSLILAGHYDFPEVCIFFNNKLIRGNRAIHTSSQVFSAFESFNYPTLADTGMDILIHEQYFKPLKKEPLSINTDLNTKVAVLHCCPTLTASLLEALLRSPVEGLVILTYGAGNLPERNQDLVRAIKKAVGNGVIFVNLTQCPHGTVAQSYEAGKWLSDLGVANGYDMTCEAALTKLCHVLAISNLTYREKVTMMEADLRGELTKFGDRPEIITRPYKDY